MSWPLCVSQNSGPFLMPPEEDLVHLKGSANVVEMINLPIRDNGEITKKSGVMVCSS